MNIEELVREEIRESIDIKKMILDRLIPDIVRAVELIINSFKSNKKVLLFGNGGSAADAQHIAAEFVGRFKLERKALPAIALSTNSSIVTALGNDYDFDAIFSRQVEAWAKEGDLVIGITTSGNSPNVLRAINKAKEMEAVTIGLTGENGGKLNDLVDICIKVPSSNTPRIQEAHITIGHIICSLVEKSLFGEKP
ncbi:MAG: D-sedoheptulose 7-phosphate isomerase [Nitrospirae bacterium]|nr:D-sedoheptulose 7-phosphate isomerase [Nitrospirota bacterium]